MTGLWFTSSDVQSSRDKIGRCLSALLPSFCFRQKGGAANNNNKSHGGIAALDGLRGIACAFVVNHHLSYHLSLISSTSPNDGNYSAAQIPILRLIFAGNSMVHLFFVISGYVLTTKPFRQMHRHDVAGAQSALASSTLRRGLRLFLPTWCMILITGFLTWLGAFESSWRVWNTKLYHFQEVPPPRWNTLYEEMKDALRYCINLVNVWNRRDGEIHAGNFDLHTWTIPIEFKNSTLLFVAILAMSPVRPKYRIVCLLCMIILSMAFEQVFMGLFLAGAMLADLDLHVKALLRDIDAIDKYPRFRLARKIAAYTLRPESFFYIGVFAVGLYQLSVPFSNGYGDPLYGPLIKKLPFGAFVREDQQFRVYGAILTVWSVSNSSWIQPMFVSRPVLYLGDISYALYLVHGNVIKGIMFPLAPRMYEIFSPDGTWDKTPPAAMVGVWFLAAMATIPTSIWLSDLFWRYVDIPSTRLARTLEQRICCDDNDVDPIMRKC